MTGSTHTGGPPKTDQSGIFICYRRDDTAGWAGRLSDMLSSRFGEDRVFIDVDSLGPGVDFPSEIGRRLSSCSVLLAVIGQRWLTDADRNGRRRLDDPADYLRIELVTGLRSPFTQVIPVLVDEARMPEPEDLPIDLAVLAHRNAIEISPQRFKYDTQQLMKAIDARIAAVLPHPRPPEEGPVAGPVPAGAPVGAGTTRHRSARRVALATAIAGVVVIGSLIGWFVSRTGSSVSDVPSPTVTESAVVPSTGGGETTQQPSEATRPPQPPASQPPAPQPSLVTVPDLNGSSEGAARTRLQQLGLAVEVTYTQIARGQDGVVTAVHPGPGAQVRAHSTVQLTVQTVAPTCPDLIRLSESAARSQLQQLGLTAKVTYQAAASGAEVGVVLNTSCTAGMPVSSRTVTLTVGQAVPSPTPSPTS